MVVDDLDAADRVLRLAFAQIRGLDDPASAFGDTDLLRTRFRTAPDAAWVAELDGEVVGSVLATRWGTFGFFGPLSVEPALWNHGVGSQLLRPVLDAFDRWKLRQAGLFTFADSSGHLRLYQKHGFRRGSQTLVTAKPVDPGTRSAYEISSSDSQLDEIRRLTTQISPGLDLAREVVAIRAQGIGETIVVRGEGTLDSMAVCHRGAGSEAGRDTCYVKFAATRPGDRASERFERLLDACETFAVDSQLARLVAGVDTGRVDAHRRMLDRGFEIERVGVSMWLRPEAPHFDAPEDYIIADLR
jgi:predicted N-acetyltransferase YhbS